MATIQEDKVTPQWVDDLYQIEMTDPVTGGSDGVANRQAKQLGQRTQWLKKGLADAQEKFKKYVEGVDTATLETAGLVKLTNDIFNGVDGDNVVPTPGSILDALEQSATVLADIHELRRRSIRNKVVSLEGYSAPSSVGGGVFWADESDDMTPDNGGTVIVGVNGVRWKRLANDVQPEYFGAQGDGVADDTAALIKSIDFAKKTGRTLRGAAKYKVSQPVNLRALPVDMINADVNLVDSGQIIIGGDARNSFNPTQSFGRILRGAVKFDPASYTVPSIQCVGAKGQRIDIKYTDYLQFYMSTDPGTFPSDASQAYSTFNIDFAIKIEIDTDPRYANGSEIDGAASSAQWFNENILNLNRCFGFDMRGSYSHNCNRIVGGTFETAKSYINIERGNKNNFVNARLERVGSVRFGEKTEGNILNRTYFGSVSGVLIDVVDKGVLNRVETEVIDKSNCTRVFELTPFSPRYNGFSDSNRHRQVSRMIRPSVNYGLICKTEKIKIIGKKDILIFDFDGVAKKSRYAVDIEIFDAAGKALDANEVEYSSGFLKPQNSGLFTGAPVANNYYGQHRFMVMQDGEFYLSIKLSASDNYQQCCSRRFEIDLYSKRPTRPVHIESAVPSNKPTQYIGFAGDVIRYKTGVAFIDMHLQTTVSSFGAGYVVVKAGSLGTTVLQPGDIVGIEGAAGDVQWGTVATADNERINLGVAVPSWIAVGDDVYISRITTV